MRAQRDRKSIGVSLSNRTLLAEDRPYAGIDVSATFFSATSRAELSSRRCCEMEKDAVSSFTEQSESDIRSMNLPACGIGNRFENETSDCPHKG